jgi:uncharacterized membrane protein YkvA (DUF1232 family)
MPPKSSSSKPARTTTRRSKPASVSQPATGAAPKPRSSRRATQPASKTKTAGGRPSARGGGATASSTGPSANGANSRGGAVASTAFKKAERQARRVLIDKDEAAKLDKKAGKKAAERRIDLGEAFDDLQTLLRLIRAYAKGEYRELPKMTMVAAAAAVIYFVNPVDLIPDAIPGVGYIDDIAVLLFVVKAIQEDLHEFGEWEDGPGGDGPSVPVRKPSRAKAGGGAAAKKAARGSE